MNIRFLSRVCLQLSLGQRYWVLTGRSQRQESLGLYLYYRSILKYRLTWHQKVHLWLWEEPCCENWWLLSAIDRCWYHYDLVSLYLGCLESGMAIFVYSGYIVIVKDRNCVAGFCTIVPSWNGLKSVAPDRYACFLRVEDLIGYWMMIHLVVLSCDPSCYLYRLSGVCDGYSLLLWGMGGVVIKVRTCTEGFCTIDVP